MYALALQCTECSTRYPVEPGYSCKECGGSLDVAYDYDTLFGRVSFDQMMLRRHDGIWKYRELLPIYEDTVPVSLGEGNTPLIKSQYIGNYLNIPSLFLKYEGVNPTLSFKDRPLSVALTVARQMGVREVVCASTGNTGVAAAAYAARAGIGCTIYVPEATPSEKLQAMLAYGTALVEVEGNFGDAYRIAGETAEERDAFNLTSTYLNPYGVEGDKTVAYELFDQLGAVPDWIIVPVGAGPLLEGCWKGFLELKHAGVATRLPRMAAVQAEGCAPIVRAYAAGEREVRPWDNPRTIASGIADPLTTYPRDGGRTLRSVIDSGGTAVAVRDDEILHARGLLAAKEGILAEASSATAVAALGIMVQRGEIEPHHTVVSVLTGHGLKDMTSLMELKRREEDK